MTYNVFGGTLNPAQSNPIHSELSRFAIYDPVCCGCDQWECTDEMSSDEVKCEMSDINAPLVDDRYASLHCHRPLDTAPLALHHNYPRGCIFRSLAESVAYKTVLRCEIKHVHTPRSVISMH